LHEPAERERLRRRLGRWLAGAAAVLFAVLALLGLSTGANVAESGPAPEFDLPLLEGGRVTNAELTGRVAVINVWASWCAPCREEAPILRRVYRGADHERVAFLGVIRNDRADDARAFARDYGLTYPNAIGDSGFASAFGVRGLPMTYLLDTGGRIVARHFGPISESRLTALIEDALARSEPAGLVDSGGSS
jgi:cytochrome c biogenesis protein CcmG/thiol:disulfide interchange protein DsbE